MASSSLFIYLHFSPQWEQIGARYFLKKYKEPTIWLRTRNFHYVIGTKNAIKNVFTNDKSFIQVLNIKHDLQRFQSFTHVTNSFLKNKYSTYSYISLRHYPSNAFHDDVDLVYMPSLDFLSSRNHKFTLCLVYRSNFGFC